MKLLSFIQPDRPDERARIETAGGRVLVVDGARVEGILATSRAIGILYSLFSLIICYKRIISKLRLERVKVDKEREG